MLTLIVAVALKTTFVFATADEDCGALKQMYAIKPVDAKDFQSFCKKIWTDCYKIEDQAAELCGRTGRLSRDADAASEKVAATAGQGKGSTVVAGNLGIADCASAKRIRDTQVEGCTTQVERCDADEKTFKGKESPPAKFWCRRFQPENTKWSPKARSAQICSTISKELMLLKALMLTEKENCDAFSSRVNMASQSPGENKVQAAERKAEEASPAYYGRPGVKYAPGEMAFPDEKACGLGGCRKNKNGTYSPAGL